MRKILVIAAHPDDEVLGCGGTIAKLAAEGHEVHTLILGEGPSSRFEKGKGDAGKKQLKELKTSIDSAAKVLGVKKTFTFDFPDNKFDSVPLLDIVKVIEKIKNQVRPDTVYTHHRGDLNIDHRITYNAALTACRPIEEETVKEIYSFEVPSSTEWNYPCTFCPNVFIDITRTIDKKGEALECYKGELRKFPHPRSVEAIKCAAKSRGISAGLHRAEAFEAVRIKK